MFWNAAFFCVRCCSFFVYRRFCAFLILSMFHAAPRCLSVLNWEVLSTTNKSTCYTALQIRTVESVVILSGAELLSGVSDFLPLFCRSQREVSKERNHALELPLLCAQGLSILFCGYILHAPAAVMYVHGGKVMIISHLPICRWTFPSSVVNSQFPFRIGKTSAFICHSGWLPLGSMMSQLKARCPFARNAVQTR